MKNGFNRTRRNPKYYLANDEQRLERTIKSKIFIDKVMFLAVVTWPRYDESGNCIFDSKIGIFPLIFDSKIGIFFPLKVEPAKRWSPNRNRGMTYCNLFYIKPNLIVLLILNG